MLFTTFSLQLLIFNRKLPCLFWKLTGLTANHVKHARDEEAEFPAHNTVELSKLLIKGNHIQTTCQQELSVRDISQNQKFNFLMSPDKQKLFHKYPYDICARRRGTREQAFLAYRENTQTLLMGEKSELHTVLSPSISTTNLSTIWKNNKNTGSAKKRT